ncbi:2-oxoacid:ferredoxin oxidoreductase subunit alpha [Helicobacter bilis]|uniref:2-oxoacid:ferredoxin oxidoreductase subunit alpha n=1 Tax=Helicobacter bilis TaxID=37372 RepID=A0A4U8U8Q9_9HELI|nr:2-oxoacid:ferredoxin oxidoreductase subunit alpha [Helicobacter bilis]MCI7410684.1 2-oxoacid:ferredoxin oxidoreductase subunit alpha [Helicobacter bilis]MDD7296850.1 2-oxoacid:ferredoxin oxidoreductase subunit alpha [Helicobacter bilis]MDY4399759.1 2-oxoacid:ferredoxin oxidoreductase subunit alpha [Helicobacter bilis]TLE08367.1 2-oxoacid:ferredoxin oxidoreductase subunit alpha [Helicobacter bilis]TLE10418.1 2-oxoacid:ferredoxin oxidoreductase subunit alpha [Helicobacter bilis]
MAKVYDLQEVEVWDGNVAASHALRQAQIDVMAAYPITPSTPIVQDYGTFVGNGYIDGEFVLVESEHAAMSGCVGAAAAGGRVATATSSQGLALMVEVLYQASGMRLPIVLNLVNRALAAPLNIHGDHSDMYLCRDAGWIQLCTCNPQEAYDFNLMAFKIAEDYDVRVPTIVNQDGFLSSHTAQNVRPLSDEEAYKFIGDYKVKNALLDFSKPVTYGVQAEEDWHYEHKAQLHAAIMDSMPVIERVFNEFKEKTGRAYKPVMSYDMDDAEVAIFAIGTTAESARVAAKAMREQGIKAGVVTIHVLRPFPYKQVGEALKNAKAVAIMDKSSPAGAMGAMFNEVSAAIYQAATNNRPILSNYVYGLGERDLTQKDIRKIYSELADNVKAGKLTHNAQQWICLRGKEMGFN